MEPFKFDFMRAFDQLASQLQDSLPDGLDADITLHCSLGLTVDGLSSEPHRLTTKLRNRIEPLAVALEDK